ncbi:tetraspanin-4-like isoform X1 [Dreissena polymorpha]|uniref:tetraspanin-4-like isoform X1 n=1 Tax=Dreissena polymorpha TaxID=45954 RepID=UPI002264E45E|nr:tetraspanin-4-like isoform X1 [Dreissena polymorpha]
MVSKTACKAFLLIINVLLFLCGAIIMGIGIWAIADKIFISNIIGSSLFNSASYIMVVVGACIIVTTFIGCGGAVANNKCLVAVFVAVIGLMFVLLLTAAILGAVFRDNLEDNLQEDMKRGIRTQYATSVDYSDRNRDVTESWDMLQQRLRCCAVNDEGWGLYQESNWFTRQYSEYDKKFVPPSCCVYENRLGQYLNLQNCQSFAFGPPRMQTGAQNNALHYRGCYTAAREFIIEQANIVLGIGFAFCVFLIAGVVMGVIFVLKLKESDQGDYNVRTADRGD